MSTEIRTSTGADPRTLSADELDLEIGKLLLADQLGSKGFSDKEARATAKRWLELNLERFRTTVCTSSLVRTQMLDKDAASRNELFAAVMDALLKLGGIGTIPVAVLTARLLHFGVQKLCNVKPAAADA